MMRWVLLAFVAVGLVVGFFYDPNKHTGSALLATPAPPPPTHYVPLS